MNNTTRIYNRFSGYTTEDCRCEYCLHYGGNVRPCLLDECCCVAERQEAARREQAAHSSDTGRIPAEA